MPLRCQVNTVLGPNGGVSPELEHCAKHKFLQTVLRDPSSFLSLMQEDKKICIPQSVAPKSIRTDFWYLEIIQHYSTVLAHNFIK